MSRMHPLQDDLVFDMRVPEGVAPGSPLVVLLHGRGADEQDLLSLSPHLPESTILVTPRAPFSARPWGYGPGWAWYRYIADDRVVEETLEESLQALDRLMGRLERELPVRPGIRIVGGFSQGGTIGLAWALTRPGGARGVVNFSGFLVNSPRIDPSSGREGELAVFWGHGTEDPNIPFSLGTKGRKRLKEAGLRVDEFDHPGGHAITPEEFLHFRRWMEALAEEGG